MFNRKELRQFFKKPDVVEFHGRKLKVWDRWYWVVQALLVGLWYKFYYSRMSYKGWENIPDNKPIIFAVSHRNAFMDALALANRHSTQVWQLARGDAWKGKFLSSTFEFFHMLPIWREQDGVDTKTKNQPTFEACYDLLSKNAMIGIYPEGNCINEEHIRPLKKGICRIAFGAMEKYNFDLDIQIIPVGVSYTGSEKFKKWQFLNIGKPIAVNKYTVLYKQNPAHAIIQLKDEVERGMRETVVHIKKSEFQKDIELIANMVARHQLLSTHQPFNPESKVYAEKEIVSKLEKLKDTDHDAMKNLVSDYHSYDEQKRSLNYRENTFDKQKHTSLAIVFMAMYFVLFLPFALFGFFVNIIPYTITVKFVERRIKQKIFWSSIKYSIGIFLFPIWYILLTLIVYSVLGSLLSALIFLISFPITGHIAFYYWFDLKKWFSVLRYKRMDPATRASLELKRQQIIDRVNAI